MWTCAKCGEQIDDQFDSCWKCAGATKTEIPTRPQVRFEIFRGVYASWDQLCSDAAEFATGIGPKNLIGISHSEDRDDGVITVWYWSGTDK